ncbi:MAG: M18 family aminopeptidase, partial [Oscillospiraceae bacterium]|nr:M18 family aminopeptidase [Oscillospiraceae bacterium]
KTEFGLDTRLVDIDRDLLVIPSVAIHMNREANNGYKYNLQTDMSPLYALSQEEKDGFLKQVAQAANVAQEDIIASDLFLYTRMKGTVLGANEELIMAPRLDDLGCAYTTLEAFLNAVPKHIGVWAMFDNEEVGSTTKQGACSTFLADTLERIALAFGCSKETYLRAVSSSMLVSADNAHAIHPNHPELADVSNPVYLNGGVVLKHNANQKYTTDAVSAAMFRSVCSSVGVQLQTFVNRSDMPGGSTLGNLSNTQISLNAVDIGLPQLAMHSAVETAGVKDVEDMIKAIGAFYNTVFTIETDGVVIIEK